MPRQCCATANRMGGCAWMRRGLLTRTFLLPGLPAFLARYPRIQLHIGQTDRLVDLVREGVDCVLRVGEPADSGLMLRRLGMISEVTVASPDYLARHGVPRSIDDLAGHKMIGFLSSLTGDVMPLEFTVDGTPHEVRLPVQVSANHSDTSADLARAGLGVVQAPRYRFAPELAAGTLVEVLADHPPTPTPLSALYPHNRHPRPAPARVPRLYRRRLSNGGALAPRLMEARRTRGAATTPAPQVTTPASANGPAYCWFPGGDISTRRSATSSSRIACSPRSQVSRSTA